MRPSAVTCSQGFGVASNRSGWGRGLLEGGELVYRIERKDGQQITGQRGEAQYQGCGRGTVNSLEAGGAQFAPFSIRSQRGGDLPRVMWLIGGTASPELRPLTWCGGTSAGPQRNPKPAGPSGKGSAYSRAASPPGSILPHRNLSSIYFFTIKTVLP